MSDFSSGEEFQQGAGTNAAAGADEGAGPANRLPFRISVAKPEDMGGIARLRTTSYGRHLPALGEKLAHAEAADNELGCEVLVATSKLDGSVLGTLRIHSNILKPLPLEASITLPLHYVGSRMAEATRLCVKGSPGSSLVRNTLFKAFFLYCVEHNVDWLLAAGRRPVDRLYDALLFSDVADAGRFYPMAHASNMPHRVMSFLTEGAEPLWMQASHPLYQFVFLTDHMDIDLNGAKSLDELKACANLHPHLSLVASLDQIHQPTPPTEARSAAA